MPDSQPTAMQSIPIGHPATYTSQSRRKRVLRDAAVAFAAATALSGCSYLFPNQLDASALGIDLPTAARYVCNQEHFQAKSVVYVPSSTHLYGYAGTVYAVYCGAKTWHSDVRLSDSDSDIAARERAGGYAAYIEAQADALCSDRERGAMTTGPDSYVIFGQQPASFTCIFGAHKAQREIAAANDDDLF